MVKNVLAAAILVALSHQACAFDLGGMLKQVQSSMEQAQQSEVQQPEAQLPTSTPQTQTQQVAISPAETSSAPKQETYEEKQERIRKFVDDKRKAQSNTTVNKSKWAAHSDEDCAAAKKLLPENIKKLSAIRISGFAIEPLACVSQELLEHCISRRCTVPNPNDYGNDNIVFLDVVNTPANGMIVTGISYISGKMNGRKDINSFYKDDAVYQGLISKYGIPINVKTEPEPYSKLVWANQAFIFNASLDGDRLKIVVALDKLMLELEKSLDKAQEIHDSQSKEKARQAARETSTPQF